MATKSEIDNNPSEFLPDTDRSISPPITNNVSGVTYGISYIPNESNRSPLSPTNLTFDQAQGISNGYSSRVNGITDFTAYNDYIHYGSGATAKRFNAFAALRRANQRFEIYSRQYRV